MFKLQRQSEKQSLREPLFRQSEALGEQNESAAGNAALSGYLSYQVSSPDDPEEIEADQMADEVVSGGAIHREAGTQDGGGRAAAPAGGLSGGGEAMDAELASSMGNAFGADFSGVRIHRDTDAARMSAGLSARAFTAGSDIYFSEGSYDPSSQDGRHLLAHELAHVKQGQEGIFRAPSTSSTPSTAAPGDPVADARDKIGDWQTRAEALQTQGLTLTSKPFLLKSEYDQWTENVNKLQGEDGDITNALQTLEPAPDASSAEKDAAQNRKNRTNQMKTALVDTKTALEGRYGALKAISPESANCLADPRFAEFYKLVENVKGIDLTDNSVSDNYTEPQQSDKEPGGEGAGADAVNAVLDAHDTTKKRAGRKEKLAALGLDGPVSAMDHTANTRAAAGIISAGGSLSGDLTGAVSDSSSDLESARKTYTLENGDQVETTTEDTSNGETNLKKNMSTAANYTNAIGSGLNSVADIMTIGTSSKEISQQRAQDAAAKKQMAVLAARLKEKASTNTSIQTLCDRIITGKNLSKDDETGGAKDVATEINNLLKDNNAGLDETQKGLLKSLLLLQVSRQASREGAKKLGENLGSTLMKTLMDVTSFAGSVASLAGNNIAAMGLKLAGALIGIVKGGYDAAMKRRADNRAAARAEQEGGESRPIQVQLMENIRDLPAIPAELPQAIVNSSGTYMVDNATSAAVDEYAACFRSVEAANIDMIDLLYASHTNSTQTPGQDDSQRMKNILDSIT